MHLSSPWTPIKKRQIIVFFAYCAFRMSVCVFQMEGEALARGVSTQLGRLAVWVRVALSTLALQINIFILACNTVALQGVPNLLTDWDGAMRYMLLPWATGDRAAPHRYSFMIYTRACVELCRDIRVALRVRLCHFTEPSWSPHRGVWKPRSLCVDCPETHDSNHLFSSCVQKTYLWRLSAEIVVSILTRRPFQVNLLLVPFFHCVRVCVFDCVSVCAWAHMELQRFQVWKKSICRSTCHRGWVVSSVTVNAHHIIAINRMADLFNRNVPSSTHMQPPSFIHKDKVFMYIK